MSAAMSTAQALRSLVGIPAEAGAKIEGRPPCRIGYQTMISESQTLPQQRVMSDNHDEDTCSCPQVSDRCGERGAGSGVSADEVMIDTYPGSVTGQDSISVFGILHRVLYNLLDCFHGQQAVCSLALAPLKENIITALSPPCLICKAWQWQTCTDLAAHCCMIGYIREK